MSQTSSTDTVKTVSELHLAIQKLDNLPTLPQVASEAMRLARDPKSSISDMVKLVEGDIALSSKVLRAANSAYYGVPRKVDNVRLAAVILGMDEISNLVTSISVINSFSNNATTEGFNREQFWRHSATVAELTTQLTSAVGSPKARSSFIAGLMHDIGKLILNQIFSETFSEIINLQVNQKLPSHQADMTVMGVDHGHIGAWLLARWHLPEDVIQGVATHHIRPTDAARDSLGVVIMWADRFAHMMDYTRDPEALISNLDSDQSWRDWAGGRKWTTDDLVQKCLDSIGASSELID